MRPAACSEIENEDIVRAFGAAHAESFEPLPAAEAAGACQVAAADTLVQGPYLRLWPHRHGTDGFFAAVWQRR